MKIKLCFLIFLSLFILLNYLIFPSNAFAAGTATIVNPLRGPQLGLEKQDLLESLKSQWQHTQESSVSATWLWQYSALEENNLVNFAKSKMKSQEHGIFLEIDKNSAEKSEVVYKGKNQWYHSDGLFLVSYDLYERRKIIDLVFTKFKDIFGYYPTSVGAWWVGSDAINYMQQKYSITAVLQCADQFDTDAYSIWGTPWSIPYLPRLDNSAVPAENYDQSSKVVVMQWATRDPNRAYGNSVKHSTFSMQDYAVKGYDLKYIEYLQDIFLQSAEDQIVFGLEGGVIPEGYQGYGNQIKQAKQLEKVGRLKIQTMKDYSRHFLTRKMPLPPTKYFLASDYQNSDQAFWYHSPYYRIGIQKQGHNISIVDLRDYINTSPEDFNFVPNTQKLLRINTHHIIDTIRFPSQQIKLAQSVSPMQIQENKESLILTVDNQEIAKLSSNQVRIKEQTFHFLNTSSHEHQILEKKIWLLSKQEELYHDFTKWGHTVLQSKKKISFLLLESYILVGLIVSVFVLIKQKNYKLALFLIIIVFSVPVIYLSKKIIMQESYKLLPYETEVIQYLQDKTKQIVYLTPSTSPEFRAVRPFLFAKPELAQQITGKQWTYIYRKKDKQLLEVDIPKNSLLIVPRYLGEDIYNHEENDLNIQKVLDNGQIAIYTKN